jgi:hypothetical protein
MYETIAKPFRRRLNLQLFAGDGGGSGGSVGDSGDGGSSGSGNGEKTFTQAELDQHVQQRLGRAEKDAQTALAKTLGYESVEAMQAALKKPENNPEDKKNEPIDVDKLVDEKLQAKLQEQNQKTYKRLLTAEVKVLANELGFADWEDAHALADLTAVKEDEKGNLSGVKEALEELLKKKPHLGKQKAGSGTFGATIGGGTNNTDKKERLELMKRLAQKSVNSSATYDPWK